MTETDSSKCACGQLQQEHTVASEGLMLWDPPESLRMSRLPEQTLRPLRVLLAEDSPIDQISTRRLLEKHGLKVFLAGDGRQAVELFEGGEFDLVLLDILMPEMDGFEVALYIRGQEMASGGHVPVIALTACPLKSVYDKCRSVGMSGYLSKPVSIGALRSLCSVLQPDKAGS